MSVRKSITVFLTDEELQFIKWMAARDDVSVQRELQMVFEAELYHLEDLYLDEMQAETV